MVEVLIGDIEMLPMDHAGTKWHCALHSDAPTYSASRSEDYCRTHPPGYHDWLLPFDEEAPSFDALPLPCDEAASPLEFDEPESPFDVPDVPDVPEPLSEEPEESESLPDELDESELFAAPDAVESPLEEVGEPELFPELDAPPEPLPKGLGEVSPDDEEPPVVGEPPVDDVPLRDGAPYYRRRPGAS